MNGPEITAVLDAGPLIHLDEVAALHLLAGYREVLLPNPTSATGAKGGLGRLILLGF